MGLLALYAGFVEPYDLRLEEVDIRIPGLPSGLDGLRILHVSDLESSGMGRRERRVARLGASAGQDLVVVTGDMVAKYLRGEARRKVTAEAARLIAGIPARYGHWFVEGHGERLGPAASEGVAEALERAGITYLRDEVGLVQVGGAELALVGLRLHGGHGRGRFRQETDGRIVEDSDASPSSYLNLNLPGTDTLTDLELSGELKFSSTRSGVGVTFHNQMPMERDLFYRLRRTASKREMHLSPHGTVFSTGRSALPWVTEPGTWYGFRVRVSSEAEGVRVRARVWPSAEEEPGEWPVDCLDATETRIPEGTVGLWASGPGVKEFRGLALSTPRGALDLSREAGGSPLWESPRAPDYILGLAHRIPQGAFPVVLSHVPDAAPHAAAMGWPLVLAGHTQGGQIRLPFIGALATDSTLGRRYAAGLFDYQGTRLFITRGIGTTRVPFRFLTPPQLPLIVLRAAPEEGS